MRPLFLYFVAQLAMGILLAYGPEGWFVVGLRRNGMEYGVLLTAVFLAGLGFGFSRRQERVDELTWQRGLP